MKRFSPLIREKLKTYVYRLEDPQTGRTFYVGKGRGNRVFQHVKMAIKGEPGLRYDVIRHIRKTRKQPTIWIHRHGLDVPTALEIEASLIEAYPQLSNEVSGHYSRERGMMRPEDLAARYGARPARIRVPAILIKIGQQWHPLLSPSQLYERTRRYWVCNPMAKPVPPKYALAVAHGVIREVYRIRHWRRYDMSKVRLDPTRLPQRRSDADDGGQIRRGFTGGVARGHKLRSDLVGRGVTHVKFGVGSPIAYMNCG